jgi:hypothetical protein
MTAKEFTAGVIACRRAYAMVATEAALAQEKDPARYTQLERRNALVAGHKPDAAPSILESLADTFWLQDVDDGVWTPNADCSNCLASHTAEDVIARRLAQAGVFVHVSPRYDDGEED